MSTTRRITTFQYMLSITCFIQSSALLTAFFSPITKQDSWIVTVMGMMAAIPLLLIYLGIMKSFPGKTLIEICKAVFGPVGGSIVSALFIWFFLSLTSLNTRDLGVLLRQTVLVETPVAITTSLCIILCAYTVYKGFDIVTRYAPVFVLMSYLLTAVSIVFTINIMNMGNFLPMLDQPVLSYFQGTNIVSAIPFGELVAFLMVTPYISIGKKGKSFYLFGGFLMGGVTITAVVARDTAVLGPVGTLFSSPSFETLRLVNLSNALNRMEILFVIVLIVLLFFKISFLYYITVLAISQLFNLKSYHPITLMLGALIVAYSIFIYPDAQVHANSPREFVAIFWMLFELLLPMLLLVVGRARGLHKTPVVKEAVNT